MMKMLSKLILLTFLLCILNQQAEALTIISPQEGQIVYQRDRLTVIVKPDAGEQWTEVILDIFTMPYDAASQTYKQEIEIPDDETGNIDFNVLAIDALGNKVKLKRNLVVKMPPNVVMQSIMVGEELMVLYIAPPNSSPEDKQRIETDQVTVAGVYTDGVNRPITPSAMGTTYVSSDEKIVTVDSEGKLTAKGLGRAKITVRNGKYSTEVRVIVKPY
jgi:hypothetical protein